MGEKEEAEAEAVQRSVRWLQDMSNGVGSHEIETIVLQNLQILQAQRGFVSCNFTVSPIVSDKDGNWHVGAITTLIDDVGAAAICSAAGHVKASLDFSISYFSTAKIHRYVKRLGDLSKGIVSHELEAITLENIEVIEAHIGHFLCKFVVHDRVSDVYGNWHVGAMATLIDVISAITVNSSGVGGSVSVDFCISYYSTAKIQEEVVIEAKVVGKKGRISSVIVEVRRKANGDLIALGKQWMSPKSSAKKPSKL